jgi:RimJ/RimL family protein N-acetyltransferase
MPNDAVDRASRANVLPTRFTTPRLRAERIHAVDFLELRRMHADPVVMTHLGGVRTEQQTRDYLDVNLRHWDDHGFGLWIVYEHDGVEPIGRALLRSLQVDGVDELEIGYALYEPYWGRGYATEIAAACIEYGRRYLRGRTFFALVSPENYASRRVLEKAGLRFLREFMLDNAPHDLFRTATASGDATG